MLMSHGAKNKVGGRGGAKKDGLTQKQRKKERCTQAHKKKDALKTQKTKILHIQPPPSIRKK